MYGATTVASLHQIFNSIFMCAFSDPKTYIKFALLSLYLSVSLETYTSSVIADFMQQTKHIIYALMLLIYRFDSHRRCPRVLSLWCSFSLTVSCDPYGCACALCTDFIHLFIRNCLRQPPECVHLQIIANVFPKTKSTNPMAVLHLLLALLSYCLLCMCDVIDSAMQILFCHS